MRQTVILIAVGAAVLLCSILLYRYFTRAKTAKTEQKAQAAPDTAELYSFFWRQSAENADACFMFSFGTEETAGHYLDCSFRTPDGEAAEYTGVPVTDAQWSELAAALRSLTLPPYTPTDPYVMEGEAGDVPVDPYEQLTPDEDDCLPMSAGLILIEKL